MRKLKTVIGKRFSAIKEDAPAKCQNYWNRALNRSLFIYDEDILVVQT